MAEKLFFPFPFCFVKFVLTVFLKPLSQDSLLMSEKVEISRQ